jgi:glycosyltransferase involved in cell wall biosynthesis
VRFLHLLPHFDYSAAGRQVTLLAPEIRSHDVHVAALAGDGPVAKHLRAAGVPIHSLGGGVGGWWRLRRLVADLRPDVVHAWRLPALRAARLLGVRRSFRLVVGDPLRGGRVNALDRRLLRSADAVVANFPADADTLRRLDVPVRELPPAVAIPAGEPPPLDAGLPPDVYVIMCVGRLTPDHGFRDAIWAADVLQHNHPETRLIIVGDGPDRPRLGWFARGINVEGRYTCFVAGRPDAAGLLARADVVWVPGRRASGRQVLLEAMAAGRPVVVTGRRELSGIVTDERTGLVAPPGNPTEVARRTRRLIHDPALAARLGTAAREAVVAFSPERVAAAYADLYARLQ